MEKYYTIKLSSLNTGDEYHNTHIEELEDLKKSNLIVCLVEKDFLNSPKCMNNLKFALDNKMEIFLIQIDNETDISIIERIYKETETYPRWIQLNDLKNLRKIFNARLR